jgi:hypothetical protein
MKYPADEPCPFPGKMIIVKTRKGSFWRMKIGQDGKPVVLNPAMQHNQDLMSIISPASKKLSAAMRRYLNGLDYSNINVRIGKCLRASIKATGGLDYKYFENLVFQEFHELYRLLRMEPTFRNEGGDVVMRTDIPEGGAVRALSGIITGYKLALVMVVGDVLAGEVLSTYEAVSTMYHSNEEVPEGCELRLVRPDEGVKWLALLRIVSYEGDVVATNPRHAGMKVVGWG